MKKSLGSAWANRSWKSSSLFRTWFFRISDLITSLVCEPLEQTFLTNDDGETCWNKSNNLVGLSNISHSTLSASKNWIIIPFVLVDSFNVEFRRGYHSNPMTPSMSSNLDNCSRLDPTDPLNSVRIIGCSHVLLSITLRPSWMPGSVW